jgi:D-aminopeptidase
VKIFISFDMEGVAGIVDWSQCLAPGQAYEEGRKLLLGEVNAAIDGPAPGRCGSKETIRWRCTARSPGSPTSPGWPKAGKP